jgi:two-component system, chemotaxis family, chemotaxis protein CheY
MFPFLRERARASVPDFEAEVPGVKYLIVDDDRLCRVLLENMLSPFGHGDVASSGAEAIGAVILALDDGDPYDLICLDIMMPGSDGHRTLEAIRAVERQRGIHGYDGVKVIMTTALSDSKHCIRAFHEGCESYVTKPVDEDVLVGAMRELGLPLQPVNP